MKHLFPLICCVLLLLSSCGKDESGNNTPQTAKRTVMVYMSAENNLSSYAQSDINEMITGVKSISEYDNLIVYVDRSSTRELPFIARLTNHEEQPVDTVKKFTEDFYSSDPAKMKEILRWIIQQYPANDYGLILWGHANGWVIMDDKIESKSAPRRAYGVDNGKNSDSPSGVWLNIPSMREALASLPAHFKFIFADCCNMQSTEVAYELRGVTDYLIASPAEITGKGAPYDDIIPDLFIYNDKEMYTKVCNDYNAQIDGANGHLPISVVRTESMDALALATKELLHTIIGKQTINTNGLIYYYYYDYRQADEHIMYDMKDFFRAHAETADYNNWLNALNQAVVYKKMSTKWHANQVDFSNFTVTEEKFGGISMFIPLDRYENTILKYNEQIKQMAWYQAVGWEELGW